MSDPFDVCTECKRDIVKGVACEMQPPNCPFLKKFLKEKKAKNKKRIAFPAGDDSATHYSPTSD